jgi:hypothetical protein
MEYLVGILLKSSTVSRGEVAWNSEPFTRDRNFLNTNLSGVSRPKAELYLKFSQKQSADSLLTVIYSCTYTCEMRA